MAEDTTAEVTPVVDPALEAAELADAQEWDAAADEMFPGLKKDSANEQTDTTTTTTVEPAPETTETTTADPNETDEQKAERLKTAEAAGEKDAEIDTASIDARVAAREAAAAVAAVRNDVRKEMFGDQPQVLQDADGDPIKSVEDVMKLINPQTKEPFTQAEAATWLVSAQQAFNQQLAEMDRQIDQITEVNLDLKDQADMISYEYGELLKAMPELRQDLWTEYEKTLRKDPKSGLIVEAPVSLNNFYKLALKPYVDLAAKLEADNVAKTEAEKEAETRSAAEQAEAKKRNRQDRGDIYGGGKTSVLTEDEKEWADAANAVFGDQLNNRK